LYLGIRIYPDLDDFDIKTLARIILIIGLVIAALAIIQYFTPNNILESIGYSDDALSRPGQIFQTVSNQKRAFGTLSGPNQLGAYLMLAFLISVVFLSNKNNLVNKYLHIATGLVSLIAIYFSFSRAAWLGILVGIAAYLAIKFWQKIKSHRLLLAGLILLFLIVILISGYSDIILRQTDQTRIDRLSQSLDLLIDNPLGLGIGMVGPASQWLTNKPIISESFYLQIGLELGISGLIILIILLYQLVRKLHDNYLKLRPKLVGKFNLAIFISLIAIIVTGLFLHSLADSSLAYTLAVLLGYSNNYYLTKYNEG
jgi:O-antigen ligase